MLAGVEEFSPANFTTTDERREASWIVNRGKGLLGQSPAFSDLLPRFPELASVSVSRGGKTSAWLKLEPSRVFDRRFQSA
jgi:hypothetical protein